MNIKLIKTKDRFLYDVDGYFYEEDYLLNGKPIEKTFVSGWYVSDEYPTLLQKKETIKVNEKWELINKDLYNETIPLIVDEHSKEKYKNLVESDLYKYTYGKKEILEDIELKIVEIGYVDDDVPFEHKEFVVTKDGWGFREYGEVYLINKVQYSLKDNCLVPTPIKELTKPCRLDKTILYEILTDYIKRNIDKNYADVEKEYRFCFKVVHKNNKLKSLLYLENDYDKRYTLKDLYAKNFKEMVKKVDAIKKETIEYINQKHICPHCNGSGCITEEFDTNKWFEE